MCFIWTSGSGGQLQNVWKSDGFKNKFWKLSADNKNHENYQARKELTIFWRSPAKELSSFWGANSYLLKHNSLPLSGVANSMDPDHADILSGLIWIQADWYPDNILEVFPRKTWFLKHVSRRQKSREFTQHLIWFWIHQRDIQISWQKHQPESFHLSDWD